MFLFRKMLEEIVQMVLQGHGLLAAQSGRRNSLGPAELKLPFYCGKLRVGFARCGLSVVREFAPCGSAGRLLRSLSCAKTSAEGLPVTFVSGMFFLRRGM